MTRNEEIKNASIEFAINTFSVRPNLTADSFSQGAKWADKTIIDRACEWLQDELIHHIDVDIDEDGNGVETSYITCNYGTKEQFINAFKKSMIEDYEKDEV